MNQTELRTTLSIALLYVVRMLGLFMVLPVLPLVAEHIKLATPFLVGTALGIYGLSQAILQIPMGIWSDRIGRKPVILAGLTVFVVGSLVAATADTINGIILGRLLQGCGAIASTLLALLSDVTRVENRAKAMAIVGMSIGASFGIALIVGPWLNDLLGVSSLFYLTAGLGCAGIFVVVFVIDEPVVLRENPETRWYPARIGAVFSAPGVLPTALGVFFLHYLLMSSFLVFPVLMLEQGLAAGDHHWYYLGLLVMTFVLMGPFMWLSDRKGYARGMLLLMVGLFVVANVFLSLERSLVSLLAGLVMFFMAFNLLEVILPAMVSKLAPAGSRGTAMGVYSTAQFAGAFVGGTLGGYLVGAWDLAYLLYVNAFVCCVWLMLALRLPATGNIQTITLGVKQLQQKLGSGGLYLTPEPKQEPREGSIAGHKEAQKKTHQENAGTRQTGEGGNIDILDAVLSVRGVIDAVIIDAEQVVYLKVNGDTVDKQALTQLGYLPA